MYNEGILIVNKKSGITSYDIIRIIKKEINNRKIKVGHAGTLDPLASGVMIILIGKATKLSDFLLNLDKKYEGTFITGIKTSTGDLEGEVIEKTDNSFNGKVLSLSNYTYNQIPPKYSSKKVNGLKAYDLARENIEFTLLPNEVTINSFTIEKVNTNEYKFKSYVSKGTYIRSLVEDFAELNGTIGTLKTLIRTEVGPFNLLMDGKNLSIYETLKLFNIEEYKISNEEEKIVKHANVLTINNKPDDLVIISSNNVFLAYYKKIKENIYKPIIII